jgi:hypothetical protein
MVPKFDIITPLSIIVYMFVAQFSRVDYSAEQSRLMKCISSFLKLNIHVKIIFEADYDTSLTAVNFNCDSAEYELPPVTRPLFAAHVPSARVFLKLELFACLALRKAHSNFNANKTTSVFYITC